MVGRVAVVTGGNKGIGYHIADSLVRSGLFGAVVIGCRDEGRGQKAARELGCDFMQLEIGNAASTASFASAFTQKYGRLDALVNNAAIAFKGADPTPFEQQTAPTLDINYRGTRAVTTRCCRCFVRARTLGWSASRRWRVASARCRRRCRPSSRRRG